MTTKFVYVCKFKAAEGGTCLRGGCAHHLSVCPFSSQQAPDSCLYYERPDAAPLMDIFLRSNPFKEPRRARRSNVVNSRTVKGVVKVLKDLGYEVGTGELVIRRLAKIGYEEAWVWILEHLDGSPIKLNGCPTEVGSQWAASEVIKTHKEGRVAGYCSRGQLQLDIYLSRELAEGPYC